MRIGSTLAQAALLPALAASSPGAARPPELAVPLVDVPFVSNDRYFEVVGGFVEDQAWSYLGTPGGLYRLPRPVGPASEVRLIAFEGRSIRNLYVHGGALYVLKHGKEASGGPATDRTFLRSLDGGMSFEALDDGLEECLYGYCSFLSPSQAAFRDGEIFTNAGGNLLARREDGEWVPLIGQIAHMACYEPAFAVMNDLVIIGGECPLDVAYIRAGVLHEGLLEWQLPPEAVITPPLENRNVHFVQFLGEDAIVFAGIEGAILRSTDEGASFDFVLRHETSDETLYPYVTQLLAPRARQGLLLAGGFDKVLMRPYLAWSTDRGLSWIDVSEILRRADQGFDALVFLHEDHEGHILAGLLDIDASVIRIVELRDSPRRRPRIRGIE